MGCFDKIYNFQKCLYFMLVPSIARILLDMNRMIYSLSKLPKELNNVTLISISKLSILQFILKEIRTTGNSESYCDKTTCRQ